MIVFDGRTHAQGAREGLEVGRAPTRAVEMEADWRQWHRAMRLSSMRTKQGQLDLFLMSGWVLGSE